jgi:hypothetical protein
MGKCFSFSRLWYGAVSCIAIVSIGFAEIPAGYPGKPYKDKAQEVPGRVLWSYYDNGGPAGVFKCDNTGEGKVGGCSVGFRSDDGGSSHPGIYQTNTKNTFDDPTGLDKYTDGTPYPSAETPAASWYIGASHASDWYSTTIHVKYKGTYSLSSTYAEQAGVNIAYTLYINGAEKVKVNLTHTGSYHDWNKYDKFKTIDLDTGLWVLKCLLDREHLNNDYLLFEPTFEIPTAIVPFFPSNSPTALEQVLSIYPASGKSLKNVQYTICEPGQTSLNIYDCSGKVVKAVFNRNLSAGKYNEQLDLSNITNGAYFINLSNNNKRSVAKINYVR